MVRPPFHVSVCPSPAPGLGWFGHRSVAPPAAPVCWALLESRLRRSDALVPGRTLSFYFPPWAFVRTWVGRLRSCLGSYLLLGALSFPCPGFRWAVPAVWLSRLLVFSWNLYLGSFLSLPVFAAGFRWLRLILGCPPSVAWQWRLFPGSCQVPVGLPSWGYSASGFLGPVVFRVFTLGHLSQVRSVFFLSPRSWRCFPSCWWVWLLAFVRGPLPQADAVGFGWRGSGWLSSLLTGRSCSFALGSSSLDLVGVGGFHRAPSPLSSFGMWSPFRVNSVLIVNEGFHWRWFLVRCRLPIRGCVVVFLRPL